MQERIDLPPRCKLHKRDISLMCNFHYTIAIYHRCTSAAVNGSSAAGSRKAGTEL